jgi:hypothetical protein
MKNIFLILFFSFPLFLNAQSGGQIKGQVVLGGSCKDNFNCLPLDSVHVKVFSSSISDTLYAMTDSIGEFLIKPLPGGIYTIVLERRGYSPTTIKSIIVKDGQTTYCNNSTLQLYPIRSSKGGNKKRKRKHHY